MQVTQPGGKIWNECKWRHLVTKCVAYASGQICNQCKWCHLVAKFGTNASGATRWSNFELVQVKPHTIGQIWKQCKWHSF